MSIPLHQIAVVANGDGRLSIRHNVPVPSLRPDMVLVKTAAVAINQVDAKMLDYGSTIEAVHGHDFAGTIVALGTEAKASGHLALGDRVAGLVYGRNKTYPDVGAFAEYVGAYADLVLKLPDGMSFEEAAGLGIGVATASLALFSETHLAIPLTSLKITDNPNQTPETETGRVLGDFVLVAGGSTASGTRAIQLLKLYAYLLLIHLFKPIHLS